MKLYKLNQRALMLGEHSYLDTSDECYFMNQYECRQRNGIKSLILELKHGNQSVARSMAEQIVAVLPAKWRLTFTFVPMPSSSGVANGLTAMVKQMQVRDKRDLILQERKTVPSHCGWRPAPHERQSIFAINELVADPKPTTIVIVDDVLTTGSHSRAAKLIVRSRWEEARVIGLFLARVCSHWKQHCQSDSATCRAGIEWT